MWRGVWWWLAAGLFAGACGTGQITDRDSGAPGDGSSHPDSANGAGDGGASDGGSGAAGCAPVLSQPLYSDEEPPILHIGTASRHAIAIVLQTAPGQETPSQDPSQWNVNGSAPIAVGRWTYPWHEGLSADGYPVTLRHHIYLERSEPLVSGQTYTLDTPYGSRSFSFDETETRCESIHVNQVGYFEGSTARFANLGVFLGDLGARSLDEPIAYRVVDERTGEAALESEAQYWGDDSAGGSGEHVYRMDLAQLPPGGPYYVVVAGLGRSYSFGVGSACSAWASRVHVRGLYHQRCGIALEAPYTSFARGSCHETVEVTDAEPPEFISERGPARSIRGGYHDAGDFDRRMDHTLIPAWMLTYFEAFPDRFSDGQYDIPESGNGVPDWLDEALWGLSIWEQLQETDGGVRAGTEADRHPTYGEVDAASDDLVYRTYRRDGHTTASAAGLFAQASRLVRPYDSARADELLDRALAAWAWVQDQDPPSAHAAQRMYAALHLYLATGESTYHDAFVARATYLQSAGWPEVYNPSWYNLSTARDGMVFSPYFFAYTITELPVDTSVRDYFAGLLGAEADRVLDDLDVTAYPMGPAGELAWGNATNQGRYADPVILAYRLTGEQRYLDAASLLADYSLGLNPIGKSYVTGLGADPPNNPTHLDSYYAEEAGMGPVPGLVVFGPRTNPSGASYEQVVWSRVYPAWATLPEQRRYSEGWSLIGTQELTTVNPMGLNVCMYGFLSPGPD